MRPTEAIAIKCKAGHRAKDAALQEKSGRYQQVSTDIQEIIKAEMFTACRLWLSLVVEVAIIFPSKNDNHRKLAVTVKHLTRRCHIRGVDMRWDGI